MPETALHRIRWLTVTLIVSLVVAACVSSEQTETTSAKADSPPGNSVEANPQATPTTTTLADSPTSNATSAPREQPANLTVGRSTGSVSVDGLSREYVLHVPESYDPAVPSPLLMVFHGYTMNATDQEAETRLEVLGEAEGFITVYPEGRGGWQRWLFELDSTDFDIGPSSPDMMFVDRLLGQLGEELAIDTDRVFALGFSNGGWMASAVACTFPDRIAAVAIVAGIMDFGDGCQRSEPVPLITLHGTADSYEPFDGGVENAPDRGMLPTDELGTLSDLPVSDNPILDAGVVDKVAWWAEVNGCDADPLVEDAGALVSWVYDCPDDASVVLYEVPGGQHVWSVASGVDTNSLFWEFLSSR